MKNDFSRKSAMSGCCAKCGKPLQWSSASIVDMQYTHGCMATAQSHINELQKDFSKNVKYCSTCSTKVRDNIILNIIFFPFNVLKAIVRLFIR
jgi:endogenous inhibitor of DNA gyrase (YacG/DUF329 family)